MSELRNLYGNLTDDIKKIEEEETWSRIREQGKRDILSSGGDFLMKYDWIKSTTAKRGDPYIRLYDEANIYISAAAIRLMGEPDRLMVGVAPGKSVAFKPGDDGFRVYSSGQISSKALVQKLLDAGASEDVRYQLKRVQNGSEEIFVAKLAGHKRE